MKVNRTSLEFVISQLISAAYRYGNVSNFQNNQNVTAILDDIKYISSRTVVSKNAKVCLRFADPLMFVGWVGQSVANGSLVSC